MNQVKFLVTIFLLTLLAAKGQGAEEVNLIANETVQMFNSPNYPGDYNSSLNCVWIITAAEGCAAVKVTFTNFSIEANFDPVKIRDGGLASSNQIVCITTSSLTFLPKCVTSTGNQIRIEFTSDGGGALSGFKANYIAINCNISVWGHWGDWSECSLCCGNGTQTRMRNCTNPPCVGDSTESRECNTHPCTVNCTGLQFTADSPFEQDCRRFYRCQNDMLTCPMCPVRYGIQEWYDPRIRQCNHPCAVNCTTACGIRPIVGNKNRIVGGCPAPINGWPWQVRLRINNTYLCGGTLIDQYWVLTAAHCVIDNTTKTVTLGAHFLSNSMNVGTEQTIAVEKCVLHPNYTVPLTWSNDVALLKLAQPAELNNAVGVACIPKPSKVPPLEDLKECYITGWGTTAAGGNLPISLMEARVPVRPDMECQQVYPNEIDESMLCAGLPQGGVDTCQGDSGGPLVCEHYGKYYVEGITSWGRGCADPGFYGVYADVRNAIHWIWEVINNH